MIYIIKCIITIYMINGLLILLHHQHVSSKNIDEVYCDTIDPNIDELNTDGQKDYYTVFIKIKFQNSISKLSLMAW